MLETGELGDYITWFLKNDFKSAVRFCNRFIYRHETSFRTQEPEDFVMEIVEKIYQGKRTCYTRSYKNFRASVYYYLQKALINWLKKKEEQSIDVNTLLGEDGEFNGTCYYEELDTKDEQNIYREIARNELREKLFDLFDPVKEMMSILLLHKLLENCSNKQAADDLDLTVRQVENLKKRIYRRIYYRLDKKFLDEVLLNGKQKRVRRI